MPFRAILSAKRNRRESARKGDRLPSKSIAMQYENNEKDIKCNPEKQYDPKMHR
jgi:hypothetical protein